MSKLTPEQHQELIDAIRGHRLDTLSQDSGKHCVCGSDSRFEQRDDDLPWDSVDEHRANLLVRVIESWTQTESVEVVRGFRLYNDGSLSPVERWVRHADGDWVSLDSGRRGSGNIFIIPAPLEESHD